MGKQIATFRKWRGNAIPQNTRMRKQFCQGNWLFLFFSKFFWIKESNVIGNLFEFDYLMISWHSFSVKCCTLSLYSKFVYQCKSNGALYNWNSWIELNLLCPLYSELGNCWITSRYTRKKLTYAFMVISRNIKHWNRNFSHFKRIGTEYISQWKWNSKEKSHGLR